MLVVLQSVVVSVSLEYSTCIEECVLLASIDGLLMVESVFILWIVFSICKNKDTCCFSMDSQISVFSSVSS